ncbi:hypothetical protein HOLleu_26270 [Holothuria leucospilota]|uniref:Uncharacterized protein n=1 Tax=Holothuria leucospilota TaxID=206669 RepID=A0A9Q1BTV6_HOLLE|nr:hypothetical protein HOLleu_26270 [Holothuria leucospilota]
MPPLSSTEDGEEDFSDMEHWYFQSYEDYKLPVPIENIKDSPILKKEEEFPPRVKGNLDIYRAPLPPIPPPVYPRPQRPPLPPPLLPPRIPKFQRKSGEYVNQTSTDVYDDVAGSWEHDRLHESCEKEAGSDRNFVELQTEPNSYKHDSSENSDDSSTIDYLELSTDRHQEDEQYTYAAPEEGYDLKKEMDDIRETLKLLLLAQKQITYSKGAEDASENANIYKRGQTLQKINNMDVSRSLQHTSRKKENHGDDVAKVADQSDEDASEEREETKKLCHTELQASKLSEKKPIDDKNLYGAAGGNEKMTGKATASCVKKDYCLTVCKVI